MKSVNMINFYLGALMATVTVALLGRIPATTGPAWAMRLLAFFGVLNLAGLLMFHRSLWWRVGAVVLLLSICLWAVLYGGA